MWLLVCGGNGTRSFGAVAKTAVDVWYIKYPDGSTAESVPCGMMLVVGFTEYLRVSRWRELVHPMTDGVAVE